MPRKKSNSTNKGIIQEFKKFWSKLDHHQQISMLATGIISLSLVFGVSVATQTELLQLKTDAYVPIDESVELRTRLKPKIQQLPRITPILTPRSSGTVATVKLVNACATAGCSGQLCVDSKMAEDIVTTCEYKEEYACTRHSTCERQADGNCGWTKTLEYQSCMGENSDTGANKPVEHICMLECTANQTLTANCECTDKDLPTEPYPEDPSTKTPVCGNNICEAGETCPAGVQCFWEGSCPQDCEFEDGRGGARKPILKDLKPTGIVEKVCRKECPQGEKLTNDCQCEDDPRALQTDIVELTPQQEACYTTSHADKDQWKAYENSCVDSCSLIDDSLVACAQGETMGCNCGPKHCWNGTQCVANPKTIPDTPLNKYGNFSYYFPQFFRNFMSRFFN